MRVSGWLFFNFPRYASRKWEGILVHLEFPEYFFKLQSLKKTKQNKKPQIYGTDENLMV